MVTGHLQKKKGNYNIVLDFKAIFFFTDFMEQWLEMMKHRVEVTTHAAYTLGVNGASSLLSRKKSIS
jgi:hypothetical protein